VWDSGFAERGSGGVWGMGFTVWDSGSAVCGLGFGVWGSGFAVRDSGLGFGVWGLECRVLG